MTIKDIISKRVSQDLQRCTKCHRCMDVCPVSKEEFSIEELNKASEQESLVSASIQKFAFSCVQCSRCVPVCPEKIRRDYLVLFIKFKIKDNKPWKYKRYLFLRNQNLHGFMRIWQHIYTWIHQQMTPDLAPFMETIPQEKSSIVFYPGCYIYSTDSIRRTIRLLDHVGNPYTILGGLTTCCGTPHFLQGEFDQADICYDALYKSIKKIGPSLLITGCAECFEALLHIKEQYKESFEVLTVIDYLMKHIDRFPQVKTREKITLHDSCRLSRHYKRDDSARHAIKHFSTLVEMEQIKESALCCYHWNHNYDIANKKNRKNRLIEASHYAPIMACECLTCYEEFRKQRNDVEIIDVIQVFDEALDAKIKIDEQSLRHNGEHIEDE